TTAPKVLVHEETIQQAVNNRSSPLIFVDISVPGDIDPNASKIPYVELFTIKNLTKLSKKNLEARMNEIQKVEEIIEIEYREFIKKLKKFHYNKYFASLIQYADSIRTKECEKALCMFGNECDARTKKVIEGFSKSIIKKIFHNFFSEVHSNELSEEDLKKFTELFTGTSQMDKAIKTI
ncbi:MAG: hypothetical protein ACFFG0_19585, partial [Candidatus Thorarchaeota archaeon]